jgi:predicted nucleic acid-binding protein
LIIPDCSVVIAWCLREQEAQYADRALDCLRDESGIVPALWTVEVGNALLNAERRKRANPENLQGLLLGLGELPIRVDAGGGLADVPILWTLSRQYKLTVYDAAYLELALRTGARLATLDAALLRAAKQGGANILEA